MSTNSIGGLVPGTATTTTAGTNSATGAATSTSTTSGTNSLSASDFMNLMIQQLQDQDPLDPTDSNQLLGQLSEISTLQSNTQMEQSLTGLTLQQSIGAGGNLIGKTVSGLDANGQTLTGTVTGVQVMNGAVNLQINGNTTDVLPLGNVESITAATGTISPSLSTAASTTGTSPLVKAANMLAALAN